MRRFGAAVGRLFAGIGEETGIVEAAPAASPVGIFRRFWPYARPYRKWLFATLLFVALAPAVEAATIWMYKVLIDEVLIPREFGLLVWVALAYLGLTLLQGVVGFFDDYLSAWVGERFLVSLRTDFFSHLHGLSLAFSERRKLGDTLTRLTDDTDSIEDFVLSGVTSAVSYAFQLLFFVGALFYLQWRLALISLLVLPVFWLLARFFSRRIKTAAREERRLSGSIGAVAEESLSNTALVQAYNQQGREVERFHRENLGSFVAGMAATRLSALFAPLVSLLELMGVLVVIGLGAYELSQGRLTIGGLLIFLVFLGQLYGPVKGISGLMNRMYAASAAAERIIEYLDERPAVEEWERAHRLRDVRGIVELENVSFCYPGKEEPALESFSLRVAPGETVALVGPSGAGKSTVARLLLRFHDPTSGSIRLDGHDLRDLELSSLRDNVAVLLQETLVFDGTVKENIAYGRPGATTEEVEQAAREADAHEFIAGLPEGYETIVGQRGRLLSGGQRQRIAIARAVIRDAPVLILDEPTTGLDAASSERVMGPLRRLMAGRTTIVVSHNLSTVRDVDRVVVLEHGSLVEQGTHEGLLGNDGVYSRLYGLQTTGERAKEPRALHQGSSFAKPAARVGARVGGDERAPTMEATRREAIACKPRDGDCCCS